MRERYVNPYIGVVVDLVDPYFTPSVKNAGGFRTSTVANNYAVSWMRRHPGRWALIGEDGTGIVRNLVKAHCPDVQIKERKALSKSNEYNDGILRTYGCIPHPEGESLDDALARRPFIPLIQLPKVTRDEFDWSPAELAEACQIARDNLFPVS